MTDTGSGGGLFGIGAMSDTGSGGRLFADTGSGGRLLGAMTDLNICGMTDKGTCARLFGIRCLEVVPTISSFG